MSTDRTWSPLELVDSPLALIRANLGPLFKVALPGRLVATLLGGLPQLFFSPQAGDPLATLAFSAVTMAAVLLSMVLLSAVTLVEFAAIREVLEGRIPHLGACIRRGITPGAVAATSVLVFVYTMGMSCMVLPGLVGLALMGLFAADFVARRVGVSASLTEAFRLLSPSAPRGLSQTILPAALVGLSVWLVLIGITTIAVVPGAIIGGLAAARAAATGDPTAVASMMSGWAILLQQLLGGTLSALVNLYPAAALTLLYHDARNRMDGEDLERALAARAQ